MSRSDCASLGSARLSKPKARKRCSKRTEPSEEQYILPIAHENDVLWNIIRFCHRFTTSTESFDDASGSVVRSSEIRKALGLMKPRALLPRSKGMQQRFLKRAEIVVAQDPCLGQFSSNINDIATLFGFNELETDILRMVVLVNSSSELEDVFSWAETNESWQDKQSMPAK